MPQLLGDRIASALALVGITKERVSNALGKDCGCNERQEKLNQLDLWARRVVSRGISGMKSALNKILEEWSDD